MDIYKDKLYGITYFSWLIIVGIIVLYYYSTKSIAENFAEKEKKKVKESKKVAKTEKQKEKAKEELKAVKKEVKQARKEVKEAKKEVRKARAGARPQPVKTPKKPKSNNSGIIVFYAAWCGASRAFMGDNIGKGEIGNEWKKVKMWCEANGVNCHQVDADKESASARRYGIQYLPTIILKNGDNIKKIEGSKPAQDVVTNFMNLGKNEKTKPDSKSNNAIQVNNVKNVKNIKKVKKNTKNVNNVNIMIFYAPWCGWSRKFVGNKVVPAFNGQVNREHGIYRKLKRHCNNRKYNLQMIDTDKYPELARRENVNGFPHTVVKVNDLKIGDIGGYLPENDFISRLESMIEDSRKVHSDHKGLSMLTLYAPWCGWSKRMVGNRFVKDYNGSFRGSGPEGEYVKINSFCNKNNINYDVINGEENRELAQKFGVQGWPGTVIFKDGRKVDTIYGYRPAADVIDMLKKLM
jgi:thiol-disulfide isomerase/thioredoxin